MTLTKLTKLGWALAFLFGVNGGFCALAADENRDVDHTALRALRDKVATAIDTQDVKTLATCMAKPFVFIAVDQTAITNEAQMQDFFDRMFKGNTALVTSMKTEPQADILTRFVDSNTGVCYGSSKDTYTMKSGKVVEMNVRWSATVVKQDGDWKVSVAHVGTDFLSNPVLDGVKKFAKMLGAGAGIGGLLVGLVLGKMFSRGKRAS